MIPRGIVPPLSYLWRIERQFSSPFMGEIESFG